MKSKSTKRSKSTKTEARPRSTKWHGGHWIRDEKRHALYARDGHKCVYCGRCEEDGISLQIDHVIPRAKGGSNHESNLVTCCDECNASKGDRKASTFARSFGARCAKRINAYLDAIVLVKLDRVLGRKLHLAAKAKRAAAALATQTALPF